MVDVSEHPPSQVSDVPSLSGRLRDRSGRGCVVRYDFAFLAIGVFLRKTNTYGLDVHADRRALQNTAKYVIAREARRRAASDSKKRVTTSHWRKQIEIPGVGDTVP